MTYAFLRSAAMCINMVASLRYLPRGHVEDSASRIMEVSGPLRDFPASAPNKRMLRSRLLSGLGRVSGFSFTGTRATSLTDLLRIQAKPTTIRISTNTSDRNAINQPRCRRIKPGRGAGAAARLPGSVIRIYTTLVTRYAYVQVVVAQ